MLWRRLNGRKQVGVTGFDHVQLAMPAGGKDQARALFGDVLEMRQVAKQSSLSSSGR